MRWLVKEKQIKKKEEGGRDKTEKHTYRPEQDVKIYFYIIVKPSYLHNYYNIYILTLDNYHQA